MLDRRQFYINGEWVDPSSAETLDVINPATEEAFAKITLGSNKDVKTAVSAAAKAFESWSQTTKQERLKVLQRIADEYDKSAEDLAQAMSLEMGAPIDMAKNAQVGAGASHINAIMAALEAFSFDESLSGVEPSHQLFYEPIGVCALITPWNWPMNQITLKVIAALAAGCTMVLKPSEIAPLSAMVFAHVLHHAGVPDGVFNLINGTGEGVGTELTSHADIDMISFTGSTHAGAEISKNAADDVKRVSLELGGKGANIIFADARADAVTEGVKLCMNNTGQSCNAPTRMLVEKSRYEDALHEAVAAAEAIKVDQPSKPDNHIGPLVSKRQFEQVQHYINIGVNEDRAQLLSGGEGHPPDLEIGYFAKPTIFADCTNDMRVMREEVFGPVLCIMPFETEDEAIKIANDSAYGLSHYIQTEDVDKARRVARKLRSGMVEINGNYVSSHAPFGGYKKSGNGREGGRWGIEEFLEAKVISGW